ncbi:MAG: hydrogenase iron-sulfur subunit [Thermoplasmata archaeon]|nr:hydrogenase iron-sulfur subunit [Thermoplasmata archaeon]
MSEKEFEPNIIAFTCTWCGYPSANLAGVNKIPYPANVKIIRVMCSGTVDPAMVLEAIENGADGVIIIGCLIDNCHYVSGNKKAEERMERLKKLFDIVGLDSRRIRTEWINASERVRFAKTMNEFVQQIREIGPAPRMPKLVKEALTNEKIQKEVKRLIEDTGAFDCVECGKCTTVCPVAKYDTEFAPRTIVIRSMEGLVENLANDKDIWTCSTCEICNSMCPYKVDYSGFIQGMRAQARQLGNYPICSQGGLIQSFMRFMANADLPQKRLEWMTDDLKISDKGDVFYFVGCIPHFDAIFGDREELGLNKIPQSAVKLMNAAGITPVVSNSEVCCGHDLIWTGDEEDFLKLMDKNLKLIKESGAKKVVFSCPECLRTFNMDYQDFAGDLEFELVHLSDYLLNLINEGKLKFPEGTGKLSATYHDSCRLGRHSKIYDSPRDLIKAAGINLTEMQNIKDKASCCGVSAWMSCNSTAMRLQMERMQEAKSTGADCLLTFCPKCQIHLSCAISKELPIDKEKVDIPTKDMVVALAELLESK